ncbi:type 1 fimbrial protein [Lelliottia amnigena]|uniref:Fimbrial protein n=1 Tax=Lelliottia amnigena TaxID=61646 RepID=A0AAP2AG65_LELAM|nr:fimbrial protein [Lelliottia amnigena]MBL5900521.1 fimbrial protein [Lelliottia amnigena]MBL5936035.1 fimbrial protein [Lelliottia amnigena]TCD15815.1 type 1 fimbrial protein [Lelliottia amnigena]
MNKTLLSLAFASLFMVGAAQAADHSAVVDINGSLTGDHSECTVQTDLSSVDLSGEIADIPQQGVFINDIATKLNYTVESTGESCYNRVAMQFHGVTDATGKVLANTDTGETAAKGVGIGLYDMYQDPLDINSQITAHTQGSLYLQMVKLDGQTPVVGTVNGALTIDIVRL